MSNGDRSRRITSSVFKIPAAARTRVHRNGDTGAAARVVIINDAMAKKYWPKEDAIGQQIVIGKGLGPQFEEPPRQIVGIVGNVRENGLSNADVGVMYVPQSQMTEGLTALANSVIPLSWAVRTATDPYRFAPPSSANCTASTDRCRSRASARWTEVLSGAVARQNFNMVLLSIFAGVALVLAAIGIYGLMSYSVDQRTQEIGIRMALGADRGRMLRVVLREGMTLAGLGVVFGLLLAYGLTRLLASLLFGVKASDPFAFAAVAGILTMVALVAAYVPATAGDDHRSGHRAQVRIASQPEQIRGRVISSWGHQMCNAGRQCRPTVPARFLGNNARRRPQDGGPTLAAPARMSQISRGIVGVTAGFLFFVAASRTTSTGTTTDVVTYHNDVARTGQNLNETSLTPTTVTAATFGKTRLLATDGKVDAQPLFLSGLRRARRRRPRRGLRGDRARFGLRLRRLFRVHALARVAARNRRDHQRYARLLAGDPRNRHHLHAGDRSLARRERHRLRRRHVEDGAPALFPAAARARRRARHRAARRPADHSGVLPGDRCRQFGRRRQFRPEAIRGARRPARDQRPDRHGVDVALRHRSLHRLDYRL